ncbi:hypothetical protein [Streptomyces altiplanensis]
MTGLVSAERRITRAKYIRVCPADALRVAPVTAPHPLTTFRLITSPLITS